MTELRYTVVREALVKDYGFYQDDFFPFAGVTNGYSLSPIWDSFESHLNDPI